MSVALTTGEILELTKPLIQPAAQVRFLRRIGIRAERRPDGSVLVLHEWLAGRPPVGAQSTPIMKCDREDGAPAQAR